MWTDMLSLWRVGSITETKGLLDPLLQKDFVWSSLIQIHQSQDLAFTIQLNLQFDPEGKIWVNDENIVWIPNSNELRLRMCIVGFSGAAGHRRVETILISVKSFCWWPDGEENVQAFCFSCLRCHVNDNRAILVLWEKLCMERVATRFCTLILYPCIH